MTELQRVLAESGPISVGVDTGGTHTDVVLVHDKKVVTLKVPTTPEDLNIGILDGLEKACAVAGLGLERLARFVYATTYVTNLITTAGFRDVLEIGRASRKPDVYDIQWRPIRPLVPRHLRLGVRERMDYQGAVLTPLDECAARDVLRQLKEAGARSIAVCLLHAYANPAHERRIAELAREVCPEVDISLSSDVVREFREYERTSTTCVNAFIKNRGRRTRDLGRLLHHARQRWSFDFQEGIKPCCSDYTLGRDGWNHRCNCARHAMWHQEHYHSGYGGYQHRCGAGHRRHPANDSAQQSGRSSVAHPHARHDYDRCRGRINGLDRRWLRA